MRMTTTTKLAAVLAAGAFVFAACGDDSDDGDDGDATDEAGGGEATGGTLTVCTDAPYEPFEFEGDDGEFTGFDMELMREIAGRMDMDMEVTVQPFEGIWLAPQAGECNIVASAMTITDDRAENALFSDPYFEADQSLLIPADDADEYESLDDLEGGTIGVQSGTTGQDYAEENAPEGAQVREFGEEGPIFLALESGDVQAVLQDLPVNGTRAEESDDFVVIETYATGESYGFATTPDNEALMDDVNSALEDIREDGTYDELFDEWFPAEWFESGGDDAEDADDADDSDADDSDDEG